MPITQQRMLDLLTSAEHYQAAFTALAAEIDRTRRQVLSQELVAQSALEAIDGKLAAIRFSMPSETMLPLAVERRHFNSQARRNDYERLRQANQRFTKATLGSRNSPRTLTPSNPLVEHYHHATIETTMLAPPPDGPRRSDYPGITDTAWDEITGLATAHASARTAPTSMQRKALTLETKPDDPNDDPVFDLE